jgi:hypothetical protein
MKSPDNERIDTRTVKMHGWWNRPDYIAARKEFIIKKPICERCGRKATTPLHKQEDYKSYEKYLFVVVNLIAQSGCSMCNKMERSNRRPCPECVKKYKENPLSEGTTIHYITQDQTICKYCEDPDYKEKLDIKKEKYNRIRNAKTRSSYKKYHKSKVIVNGKWVESDEKEQ